MSALVFDIEATGLLRCGSFPHCIVTRDLDNPSVPLVYDDCVFGDWSIDHGLEHLADADVLIGHNIAGYDIPLLEEWKNFEFQGQVLDTLVLSQLYYANLKDKDFDKRPMGLPPRLYGSHSLKAWGYRLHVYKGDYAEHEGAWDTYTAEMLDYCKQDTLVTLQLYRLMARRMSE